MNIRRRSLALIVPLLALSACGQDKPKESAASGEILPGSVSDAMLPEDRLTSQPPLAPMAARPGKEMTTGAAAEASAAPAMAAPAEPDANPAAKPAAE
jgi:hypothetical protein